MKTKLSVLLISFLFVLSGNLRLTAQVTVGSNTDPVRAALLDVKGQAADADNITSKTGGLALPRVNLVDAETLQPFIATTDADWTDPTKKAQLIKNHTGLMVYNLNTTSPFAQGIYVWTGAKWVMASGLARNGLNQKDGYVQLGGALSQDETIITGDKQDLIIDLKNVSGADKGFMIKGLSDLGNSVSLVINDEGKLGKSPVIPARLAFFQSGDQSRTPGINTRGNAIVVKWNITNETATTGKDLVTNNIVDWDQANNAFIMRLDAAIEMSAMLGYQGGGWANPPTNTVGGPEQVIVNATLQVNKIEVDNNGDPVLGPGGEFTYTGWADYSSVRGVYTGATNYYRNTLNIPPAMMSARKGDKIRLVVMRPPDENKTTGQLGHDHQISWNYPEGDARNPMRGIVRPYGTEFSKSLKIVVQGAAENTP